MDNTGASTADKKLPGHGWTGRGSLTERYQKYFMIRLQLPG
jgi:hypothetical protein